LAANSRTMRFGGHTWIILSKDRSSGTAFIMTKDVIGKVPYSSAGDYSWENSDLRSYLEAFYFNTFSGRERRRVVEDDIGYASLLFPNDRTWLKANEMIAMYGDRDSDWFLRPIMNFDTFLPDQVQIISSSGEMRTIYDLREEHGVRPCLTIKLR